MIVSSWHIDERGFATRVETSLAAYLRYADNVRRALPVDHEADRAVGVAMRRAHEARGPGRKLFKKILDASPENNTPTPRGDGDK